MTWQLLNTRLDTYLANPRTGKQRKESTEKVRLMVINETCVGTPYYVLLDREGRIGPRVVRSESESECSAIYGFADKDPYDAFCTNSGWKLRPYPLVKGFLQNQLNAADGRLQLVALDAVGPSQPILHATTMAAVLEAHEAKVTNIYADYRLEFDEQLGGYRVQHVSA